VLDGLLHPHSSIPKSRLVAALPFIRLDRCLWIAVNVRLLANSCLSVELWSLHSEGKRHFART
jgi:hypothetical protein